MGVERGFRREPEPVAEQNVSGPSGKFFGYDVSWMSSKVQVAMGLAVLLPTLVVLGSIPFLYPLLEPDQKGLGPALFIFLFFSSLGWTVPAAALMMRGVAELRSSRTAVTGPGGSGAQAAAIGESAGAGERAVLKALRENGEMSAARAAAEASLTAAEADEILSRLARDGHLRLRIRGVGLFYSLWETGVEEDESG